MHINAFRAPLEKGVEKVARNMLKEGARIAFIKKTTGLFLQKFKKMQWDLKEKNN